MGCSVSGVHLSDTGLYTPFYEVDGHWADIAWYDESQWSILDPCPIPVTTVTLEMEEGKPSWVIETVAGRKVLYRFRATLNSVVELMNEIEREHDATRKAILSGVYGEIKQCLV